jgi:hypothetical protein
MNPIKMMARQRGAGDAPSPGQQRMTLSQFIPKSARHAEVNPVLALNRDAKLVCAEKRALGRNSYLKPAVLHTLEDPSQRRMVFTRDVSRSGIGLMHIDPIEPQLAKLSIELESGDLVEVGLKINWCIPCGGDWYISGGDFCEA